MKKLVLFILSFIFSLGLYSQEKPKLAVVDFMPGVGICESQVNGLSDMLINALFDLGKFSIIERTQIEQVLKEQGFQKSSLSSSQLTKVGQILGVNYILAGTVNFIVTDITTEQIQTGMASGEFNIDIRVVDVVNGEIIATAGVTKTSSQTYRSLMPKLAEEINEKLNKKSSGGVVKLLDFLYVTPIEFDMSSRGNIGSIVDMLNRSNYCGFNDWRMPTRSEADILSTFGIKVSYVKCPWGSCSSCSNTGYYQYNSDAKSLRFVRRSY